MPAVYTYAPAIDEDAVLSLADLTVNMIDTSDEWVVDWAQDFEIAQVVGQDGAVPSTADLQPVKIGLVGQIATGDEATFVSTHNLLTAALQGQAANGYFKLRRYWDVGSGTYVYYDKCKCLSFQSRWREAVQNVFSPFSLQIIAFDPELKDAAATADFEVTGNAVIVLPSNAASGCFLVLNSSLEPVFRVGGDKQVYSKNPIRVMQMGTIADPRP